MTSVKIILKTKRNGVYVDYEAKIGNNMMMHGRTLGGNNEVKQIIRRALRGGKPLPNRIKEIVTSIARQVLLWIDMYKLESATAGMSEGIGEYSDISVYATVRCIGGCVAELVAVLDGFDGFITDASHGIMKIVDLSRRPDGVTASLLLQMNLLKVAKYAYNIYVEEDKLSYFDSDDDDSELDYSNDDGDDYSDDDGDDTSLKAVVP